LSTPNDNKLQKRSPTAVVEKGQYALAFIVVAAMLVVAGFPAFVVFFFGIFAYFLWKIFTSSSRSETRDIFEFYLAANEMLRDDDRRWYGFEMRDVVARGARIIQSMTNAPPLVHFAVGALLNKIGEHKDAVTHLTAALESDQSNEMNFVFPSAELRNYVKVLRKIEREPAEAPMTSAAVRSLERARRLRGKSLLEQSKQAAADTARATQIVEALPTSDEQRLPHQHRDRVSVVDLPPERHADGHEGNNGILGKRRKRGRDAADRFNNRKPISEVLHDIYDNNTH
jgi:hypothetical protein